jgi:Fic family protein
MQTSVVRALGEHQGRQELFVRQTPEVLTTLRNAAVIESSESSNRLEGVTAPRGRIDLLVLHAAQPVGRDEAEIAGYRDALQAIHADAPHLPFRELAVRQLHDLLYRYLPARGGQYKSSNNSIVERAPDDSTRLRFQPVGVAETPPAMADLIRLTEVAFGRDRREPLIIVPLVVLDFLCIHPFADGNGRTARLLTLLLLYQTGHNVGRYISLERVIEQSRESYYDALYRSSQGWHDDLHDPHPWLNYFWSMLLAAYKEFEDRVGTIKAGRGGKSELVRAWVNGRVTSFKASEVAEALPGVSSDLIRSVLRQLRDEGAAEVIGQGRGARWRRTR